eukprot:gene17282-biopygen26197
MQGALVGCLPLTHAQDTVMQKGMIDRMATCFLQTHARLRASERDCKRALLEKIVWRHCLFPRSAELLEVFREKDTPLIDAIVKVYVEEAPMDVRNYASRTREVIKTLELGVLDPVSDMYVSSFLSDEEDNTSDARKIGWSCIEALTHGICLDGYLWRTDFRGAVYVTTTQRGGHNDNSIMLGDFLDKHCPCARHTCMPWQIFLSTCPLAIYDRIIVELRGGGGSAHDDDLINTFTKATKTVLSVATRLKTPMIIGSVVVVENRPNVWSMLSVLVTLDNLDVRRWPCVVVFCAPANERFVERCLLPHLVPKGVELVTVVLEESLSSYPHLPGQKPFSINTYSALLKSAAFWRKLKAVAVGKMALFVQDDGMVVRPGIEDDEELMAQDYVGAPWADTPANAELKRLAPTLVGNGGLSLRRVDACLDVVVTTKSKGVCRLFNLNLQPEPEDVFFVCCDQARLPNGSRGEFHQ